MQMSDEEVPDVELPSDVGSDVELPADVGADPDDTVAATQVVVESPKLQVHRKPSHKALQEVKKKPCAKKKPVQKRNTVAVQNAVGHSVAAGSAEGILE